MDNKKKEKKSSSKTSYLKNLKNYNWKISPIPKEKNNIKVIKLFQGRRNAMYPSDDKESDINKEFVFKFLSKNPGQRNYKDIQGVSQYLSQNYKYFHNIKLEHGMPKLEKITKICRLETAEKDSTIIKYGDIGDKFYIVLEGSVEIFKPKFIEINETPRNFFTMLRKIIVEDKDDIKYKRIKSKNENVIKNIPEEIILNNNENNKNNGFKAKEYSQLFYFEIDEKMGEYGVGFSFGDIALINKCPRNATIKAKKKCVLLTISNDEYNKAILEFQRQKLNSEIDNFIKTYSFFRNFNSDKIIRLFNCFTKKVLFNGEFLYKQNMEADSIYILNNGSFMVYSCISFPWINDYIEYIDYSEKNILQFLIENKNVKIDVLTKILQDFYNKCKSRYEKGERKEKFYQIDETQINDNLYKLKRDEEKLNSPDYVFKLNLKKVEYNDVLGLEEAFEFKKRFCYYKCISDKAELKEVKITELIRLILSLSKNEIIDLMNIIQERKKLLKNQIIKAIQHLDKELISNFDLRYENIIKSTERKDEEEKSNILLSSLRAKGYKTTIQDILDKKLSLFPQKEKLSIKEMLKKLKRKNKSSEEILDKFYKNKNTINELRFDKKRTNIRLVKQILEDKKYLSNLILKSHSSTPNISSIKKIEHNNLSSYNSNKLSRNNLLASKTNSTSFMGFIKKDMKSLTQTTSSGNKKLQDINLNDKLLSNKKKISFFESQSSNKDKKHFKIINKLGRKNNEHSKELKLIKRTFDKGDFLNLKRFSKNFFMSEEFMKKCKKGLI